MLTSQKATIKAERDSLQTRLTQAEKDLADAKAAAVSTTTAGDTGPDASRIQELSSQVEQLEKDKAAQDQVSPRQGNHTNLV